MSSLLSEINESADSALKKYALIVENINHVAEYLSLSPVQLNEAATVFLSKIRNSIEKGTFNTELKKSVSEILGALKAVSQADLADALDEEGNLGTILYNASGEDKNLSKEALNQLVLLGRHPSVKTYTAQAFDALNDAQTINDFTKNIQLDIEKTMNRKIKQEKHGEEQRATQQAEQTRRANAQV